MRSRRTRWAGGWLTLLLGGVAGDLAAQDTVEVEALQCWRRIGRNAVHIGERFDMMLTCRVVETDTARAVPDLAWLEPETLAVSPFEVLEGERYRDIVRGPRRFFQYRYSLRIIGEDYFGLDVELPALEVKYRIERALETGVAAEGRELTYLLPPESVRVLALVPATGTDIRELPGETFGAAEARLFRANATGLAAAALGVVAVGLLLLAAARARREWRGTAAAAEARVSAWRVARSARGELTSVRRASADDGWTAELVGRALRSFRVAAALALELPVAQVTTADPASLTDRESRLAVRPGLLGGAAALVSASVTLRRVEAALPAVRDRRPGDASLVESLRDGLAAFSAARYGADPGVPADRLSRHVETGLAALRTLTIRALPPVRFANARRRSMQAWMTARWRR